MKKIMFSFVRFVSSPWYLSHSDLPVSFIYYAYKWRLNFFHNAMGIIFCSFVKIITTHADTHAQIQKILFTWSNCCDCDYTSQLISRRQPQICHVAHVSSYTHILNITYTTTHNNMQIKSTKTHTNKHTHKQIHKDLYTILMFFWLHFLIFSISPISFFLCLMIFIYETAWNL